MNGSAHHNYCTGCPTDELVEAIQFWLNENEYNIPPEGTLNRDFLCLSSMYSRFKRTSDDEYENTLTCPFKDLRMNYNL